MHQARSGERHRLGGAEKELGGTVVVRVGDGILGSSKMVCQTERGEWHQQAYLYVVRESVNRCAGEVERAAVAMERRCPALEQRLFMIVVVARLMSLHLRRNIYTNLIQVRLSSFDPPQPSANQRIIFLHSPHVPRGP